MIESAKGLLLGNNGHKGLLQRSGIVTALMTTIFVILKGWAAGDILAGVVSQQDTLLPMWIAAVTTLIGNPSKA